MTSSFADECNECFGSTDLYFILQINDKESLTTAQVKKAYYKQSMLWHPDRFADEEDEEKKNAATRRFQIINKAYTILSDPEKRELYDNTGIVGDEMFADFGEADWTNIWKMTFAPVTPEAIDKFLNKYRGSDEETNDLIATYNKYKGDMNKILETFIGGDDEDRTRFMLNDLIARGEVEAFPKFVNEPDAARKRRQKKREREAKEAAKSRKEMANKHGNGQFDLVAALAGNQERRAASAAQWFAQMEAKYGGGNKRKTGDDGASAKKKAK